MSQINNVITTTFRARGGQAIAQQGMIAQGFGRIGNSINQNTRLSERLNAQWRALGTTIRYAIAGTVVFGLARMVTQLKDVQQQLGLIQAIGSQAGGGQFGLGRALDTKKVDALGKQLQRTANESLQPINEVNDATINFLSTVQNVNLGELPTIIRTLGIAAKFSQAPVEDLTKAATTMNIAFGRANNQRNIAEFSRQFFALTAIAPGGRTAGHEITQQMGPLSSIFQLAPGRNARAAQAQQMSLTLGALRFGGTPATAMRGLTFFLQSLVQPATPAAKSALAGIGITPQFVQQRGVYAAAMKFLRHIRGVRNPSRLAAMDEEALGNIEDTGGNLPGIPASQSQFLRTALGRIHGIRAAVILSSQLSRRGGVQSLAEDLKIMQQAQDNELKDALNMAKQWQNFRNRAKLQEAAIAVNTMSLQVAQIFEPVLNFVARHGITGPAHFAQRHETATKGVVLGGAGLLAALGLGRVFARGALANIPGIGGMLAGGSIGNRFVQANAIQAAISGNAGLGATPQNPMYVTIVGQLFGGGGGLGPGRSTPFGRGGAGGGAAEAYTGYRVARGGLGFARRGLRGLIGMSRAGLGLGRELPVIGAAAVDAGTATGLWGRLASTGLKFGGPAFAIEEFLRNADPTNQGEDAWIRRQNLRRAQQIFSGPQGNVVGVGGNTAVGMMHGHAEIWMTINVSGPGGKITQRRVHVPVSVFSNGRYPSAGGKPGNRRSG